MKQELETLRQELNSRIDAVIAKIEKPQFEVGKWYKTDTDNAIFYITEITEKFNNPHKSYGILRTGTWDDECYRNFKNDFRLATPKEVEEALKKEILKKFNSGNKFKCLANGRETNFDDVDFSLFEKNGRIYSNASVVYENGIFATPIKTMTIDELATELQEYTKKDPNSTYHSDYVNWFTENKQQIIETLITI